MHCFADRVCLPRVFELILGDSHDALHELEPVAVQSVLVVDLEATLLDIDTGCNELGIANALSEVFRKEVTLGNKRTRFQTRDTRE